MLRYDVCAIALTVGCVGSEGGDGAAADEGFEYCWECLGCMA
jgi:hypothetical protein